MNTGTFVHSITVPRLYKCAAKIAKQSKEDGASIKNLVYEKKHTNIKGVYALVVQTLKRQPQLDFLIKKSQLFEKEPRFDHWLARILITELIWGKKRLPGESKPVQTILAYEQVLKAHLTDAETHEDYTQVKKPRFVRVNALKLSLNDAVDFFREEGWMLVQYTNSGDYGGFLERVAGMNDEEFIVDIHVDNLLIFPPSAQFYNHPGYLDGQLTLQDKASCLPTQLLNPPEGSIILDMCAAPGMKTTHLAAHINNNGKIFSIEKNEKRCETLRKMVETAGASCVQVLNKDTLTITDKDIPNVEYILVDPSCSGSGMVDRLELEHNANQLEERLKTLAGFQIKLLKHSLRNFPKVKRVVYSTCSIYPQENEEVVSEVIAACTGFKLLPIKDLLKAEWHNFASNEEGSVGSHCLYAKPEDDLTNGFFIAVFERLSEGEENAFLKQGLRKALSEEAKIGKKERRRQWGNAPFDDNNIQINQNNENINTNTNSEDNSVPNNINLNNENQEVENNNEDIFNNTEVKKKKKKSKKEVVEINNVYDNIQNTDPEVTEVKNDAADILEHMVVKKKKKSKHTDHVDTIVNNTEEILNDSVLKKKKKHKNNAENVANDENTETNAESNDLHSIKKKKKKRKQETLGEETMTDDNENTSIIISEDGIDKKKKKKAYTESEALGDDDTTVQKKKKKKHNLANEILENDDVSHKKKKEM